MTPDLTPAQIERLAYLAEELGEAIQAVGKILRHGYDSGEYNNRQDLMVELADVWGAICLLARHGETDKTQLMFIGKAQFEQIVRGEHPYLHHDHSV